MCRFNFITHELATKSLFSNIMSNSLERNKIIIFKEVIARQCQFIENINRIK